MNMPPSMNNSLTFNLQQKDYGQWPDKFGAHVQASTTEGRVEYPAQVATGYATAKTIEPGLSYRIINYTLHSDVVYKRNPSAQFQLMISFYELHFSEKIYCKAGSTVIESTDGFYSASIVSHSLTTQEVILKKGTTVKGLCIEIEPGWLKDNILDFTEEKMELLRRKDCLVNFINARQRKILHDIFDTSVQTQLPDLFIRSRVLRLAEQFLTNLCNHGLHPIPQFTNQKDFQALLKIEYLLSKKYNEDFPSIEALAKTAYMSESKLKKLFKKAYGMAPYEYYQKNRMHKAKELLRQRKHSVSQVGSMLGYQNMSNFSAAFKKEFDCLPSQAQDIF